MPLAWSLFFLTLPPNTPTPTSLFPVLLWWMEQGYVIEEKK